MREDIDARACDLAVYLLETGDTVRGAAKHFGISKSTIHKDLTERLPAVNRSLAAQIRTLLAQHKAERHIRGGAATRRKYRGG